MINKNEYSIYVHINKINGKMYIGQTCQKPEKRWNYGNGYKNCIAFTNAIKKYGWDSFKHIVLIENLTNEEANIFEEYLIKKYNTTNCRFGYNIKFGGSNSCLPETVKAKIKAHASKHCLGKPKSDEIKNKISKKQTGKKYSDETNKKKGKPGKENYFYGKLLGDSINAKPVLQVKDNIILNRFSCAKEASLLTNIDSSCITKCCKNKRKTAGGYEWQYAS